MSASLLPYQRIATEEAFSTPEILDRYRAMLSDGSYSDPGFKSLLGFYLNSNEPRVKSVFQKMCDLGPVRIADMDVSGIARQLLSLAAPGVQVFPAALGTALARSSNDILAEAIRHNPDRFSGLAAVAPQSPAEAAKELERGVKNLGLKGAIINSHTQGEFLDDPKFWAIFEAAEALDVPVYIHPTGPPASMIGPFLDRGLDGAIYGFAAETGLHLLRIIVAGVFDRFPKLRIVSGHLGEGLPYWLFRVDFMHARMVAGNRYESVKKLQRKPSDYVKENMYVTTSGMAWEPPIRYAQQVLGMDRVMYAMDYPWQFVPAEVKATDDLPITAEEKKMLYQTNAERIFRL
jgi:2,3-dihydroxybenzoate decarboxylase